MTNSEPVLLWRRSWDAADLMAAYPAAFSHPLKQLVYEIACPQGMLPGGTIEVTRWREGPLPDRWMNVPDVSAVASFFEYEAAAPPALAWYLNFADRNLFAYYGGGLFAQDEMQVAEHPSLASVRSAMLASGEETGAPLTEDAAGATPILVRGAERRCRVATSPDASAGRPQGLYGNRFAQAEASVVRRATTRIDPASISNILAIAAPGYGSGAYLREHVERILHTAHAGFRAAVMESQGQAEIHTGYWGCGAFGGNRVLMTALQIAAAALAGVHRIVFHLGADDRGFADGRALANEVLTPGAATDSMIAAVVSKGLRWGQSDGN